MYQAGWCSGNNLNFCSGGMQFTLSWVNRNSNSRFFVVFLSPIRKFQESTFN